MDGSVIFSLIWNLREITDWEIWMKSYKLWKHLILNIFNKSTGIHIDMNLIISQNYQKNRLLKVKKMQIKQSKFTAHISPITVKFLKELQKLRLSGRSMEKKKVWNCFLVFMELSRHLKDILDRESDGRLLKLSRINQILKMKKKILILIKITMILNDLRIISIKI